MAAMAHEFWVQPVVSGDAVGEAPASEASAGGEDTAGGVLAEVVELAPLSQLL